MSDEIRLALKAGTEIDGYRIESVLGAGGFGITYRATEIVLGRTVAIKEFLPSGIATREEQTLAVTPLTPAAVNDIAWGMDRFRAEAQTLVAFQHPNIVGVHRYFEANGTGYLVMAFVEGQTLGELLFPDKALDESEISEILDPLLDGLQAVHDRGFLHRDIKPANIFIREDGSPVLIDFGAARQAFGQHSKSLTAIISEGYAPFEQYDSAGDQGPWTDIYALGGVLYRCVTGQRPPDAPSRVTALMRGRDDPMKPAAALAKGRYTAALLSTIDAALMVQEDARPQSIGEFRDALAPVEETAQMAAAPRETGAAAAGAANASVTISDAAADGAVAPPASDDETLYAGPAKNMPQATPQRVGPAAIEADTPAIKDSAVDAQGAPPAPKKSADQPQKHAGTGDTGSASRQRPAEVGKRKLKLWMAAVPGALLAAGVLFWLYGTPTGGWGAVVYEFDTGRHSSSWRHRTPSKALDYALGAAEKHGLRPSVNKYRWWRFRHKCIAIYRDGNTSRYHYALAGSSSSAQNRALELCGESGSDCRLKVDVCSLPE